ncbi:MAG: deoxyribose-phosphate aldolase [Thermogemmata sp.]
MTTRLSAIPLARRVDYTLIRPDATENDLRALCHEAVRLGVRVISVNPVWAAFCARLLEGTRTGLDVYIAYPLGAATARMKMEEAREAVTSGATEVSITVNMGAFLSGYFDYVEKEIAAVVRAVNGIPVKAIAETSLLTTDQAARLAGLCAQAGAIQFQVATGFGRSVPDPATIAFMPF